MRELKMNTRIKEIYFKMFHILVKCWWLHYFFFSVLSQQRVSHTIMFFQNDCFLKTVLLEHHGKLWLRFFLEINFKTHYLIKIILKNKKYYSELPLFHLWNVKWYYLDCISGMFYNQWHCPPKIILDHMF